MAQTLQQRSAMWLEAILSLDDLRHALGQLTPVTISLGSEGAGLYVGAPSNVSLVAGEGLQITCAAELTWPVLGIAVPVVVSEVSFMLTPRIERVDDDVELLAFVPHVAHADFAMLPGMLDRRLTELVNKELDRRKLDLAWNFGKTLTLAFGLPASLSPLRTMSLNSHGAMVRVTEEAVVLAISMKATIKQLTASSVQPA